MSTVEVASPAIITTRDITINTSCMQRAGRKLVNVIDCSGTALHECAPKATLASTGRHSHGRSIPTFRTTLPMHERHSIRRQSRHEAMASRCFWWPPERVLELLLHRGGAHYFVLFYGNLLGWTRGPCGAISTGWLAPQGSGERTDGSGDPRIQILDSTTTRVKRIRFD